MSDAPVSTSDSVDWTTSETESENESVSVVPGPESDSLPLSCSGVGLAAGRVDRGAGLVGQ